MPFAPFVDQAMMLDVVRSMAGHVIRNLTPICRVLNTDGIEHAKVVGSGAFVQLAGRPYIVTNEHVARHQRTHRLAHFRGNDMEAAAILHDFVCLSPPEDMAIARVVPDALTGSEKATIPTSRIATHFAPADGELVFVMGFPGSRSRFSALAGGLQTWPVPYVTDVANLPALPDGFRAEDFFALSFPGGEQVVDLNGNRTNLPTPEGMSGCLVWNTRFVELGPAAWSPSAAVVCGIVQQWDPSAQCLLAARAQVLRRFFLDGLRIEAAHQRWIGRGSPSGEEWNDVPWAEESITSID